MASQDTPTDQTSSSGLDLSPGLVLAVKRLLRPLVRLLVAKGVTYPFLADLLKSLYIDVASKEFSLPGKRQTDSRLSLLTGVHRKDVRRLMSEPDSMPAAPSNVSFGARLVARWCGEAKYLDEAGQPRALPRLSPADGGPSFDSLVADESKDIRARAVLDEWLRLGLAVLDEQDQVSLRANAFVPEKGFEEKVYFLGRNLRDHLAAASHNVLDGKPPFLDRCVYSDGLNEAARIELAALAERLGMEALLTLNKRVRQLRESAPGEGNGHRVNFGVYFYSEAPTADPDSSAQDASQP